MQPAVLYELGGLLARSLAKHAVLRGLAGEAQVTLAYTPGCDWPVGVDSLFDVRPVANLLDHLGQPETVNRAVWRDYVVCEASLPELACGGHQQVGLPWEGGVEPAARRPSCGPAVTMVLA